MYLVAVLIVLYRIEIRLKYRGGRAVFVLIVLYRIEILFLFRFPQIFHMGFNCTL